MCACTDRDTDPAGPRGLGDPRGLRTGINTEVSRYILGIGNTKQLTTNTIYRIGSLLYILARINILGGAPGGSMFGANLIKCQLSLPRAKSESV